MAASRFDLAATTDTLLYTATAAKKRVVNVNFAARTQAANIRLAHTSGGAPADTDYLVYDLSLPAIGAFFEKTQIWIENGEKLYARASATGVSVVVYGPPEENL